MKKTFCQIYEIVVIMIIASGRMFFFCTGNPGRHQVVPDSDGTVRTGISRAVHTQILIPVHASRMITAGIANEESQMTARLPYAGMNFMNQRQEGTWGFCSILFLETLIQSAVSPVCHTSGRRRIRQKIEK